MSTRDQFVNLVDKRLLGFLDFRERLLKYLQKYSRDIHQTAYGMNGVFGGTLIQIQAHGAGRIQLTIDPLCSDGQGHFLSTAGDDLFNGRIAGIPFENTNAVVYRVGLHYAERPRTIQINSSTGLPEFVAFEETLGQSAVPGSVVNNGANLTFNVDGVCQPFIGAIPNYGNRTCLVWKNAPGRNSLSEAVAVEAISVVFAAGHNTITTAGLLGQPGSSVSTLAADYTVLLIGPTISSTQDLSITPGYTYIGTVTGNGGVPNVFSNAGQNNLSSGFAVDLNQVTRLDPDTFLKLRVRAAVADVEVAQIEVDNAANTRVWFIDEDGDMFVSGVSNLLGNVIVGTDHTQTHTLHGRLTQINDLATTIAQLLETGELGLRGAAVAGVALKTWLRTIIGNADAQLHDLRGDLRTISDGSATTAELRSTDGHLGLGGVSDSVWLLRVYGDAQIDETLSSGSSQLAGSAANDAQIARRSLGTLTHPYALIDIWRNSDNTFTRIYGTNAGGMLKTVNAYNDGSGLPGVWAKDVGGIAAHAYRLQSDYLTISSRAPGNNANWSTWDVEHTIPIGSANPATLTCDILPTQVSSQALGRAANRWDAFLRNVDVSGTLLPDVNNQAFGAAAAANRWLGYFQDVNAAGEYLFSAARAFRKIFTMSGGFELLTNATKTLVATATFLEYTIIAGGNPSGWQEVFRLDLPQGALVTAIVMHWRTGTGWTGAASALIGAYRAPWDHTGAIQYFDNVGGLTNVSPAPGTNLTDTNSPATLNSGAAGAPIDNSIYAYWVQANVLSLGSTDINSSRFYSIEVQYTMDRSGRY